MDVIKSAVVKREAIGQGRSRYLTYLSNLMMVVIDLEGGPSPQPDPPHSHPHEQISYVVSGEVNLFIKDKTIRLEPGDMFAVPPNVPHGIQLLSEKARLVDTFCPIREDFLKK